MISRRRTRITQVLRALEREAAAPSGYSFGALNRFSVKVASSPRDRARAWALAYRAYLEKEYAARDASRLWYGLHDALPNTLTLLVEEGSVAVAALTLVLDSPLALPADELYGRELDRLRARGRKLCELVSLVSADTGLRSGVEITKHLFRLAYLAARRLEKATDFVITVNPRHVRYYRRVLLMEELGQPRDYNKVGGAPAVLLRLDLETAEERFREKHGERQDSFFRFFVSPDTEPVLLAMLRRGRRPMGESALCLYFSELKPLMQEASSDQRRYLEKCYPFLALRGVDSTALQAI